MVKGEVLSQPEASEDSRAQREASRWNMAGRLVIGELVQVERPFLSPEASLFSSLMIVLSNSAMASPQ